MSEITINNLPPEVIINILRRLDQDTLKDAALTCNLWKQIAESYCSWSVDLHYRQSNAEFLEFFSTTDRKIGALKIYDLGKKQHPHVMGIFKKHGSNMRKLTLINVFLGTVSDVVEMLKQVPNLKQLCLSRVKFVKKNAPLDKNDFPTLAKLKTLDFVESDCSILECFESSKIITLKFRNFDHENKTRLSNLLTKQTNLKSLDIAYIDLFYLEGKMPFQLSKLCLGSAQFPGDLDSVISFLKFHAKTLQELELGNRSPRFIYEFLFSNLDNLKSLHCHIHDVVLRDVEFYKRLNINKSISHLTLMDSPPPKCCQSRFSTSLKEMLTRLPNLTNVCFLTFCPRKVLPFITKELENEVDVQCFNECCKKIASRIKSH